MDDYKKLARVMKYLRNTRHITLTMEAGSGLKWWVDSSYAVHPDMRSHSGIFMTLGDKSVRGVKQTEVKYKELHRSRIGGHR